MQVINPVLQTSVLSETHMGLPRIKQESWLCAKLERSVLELLAVWVLRDKGCLLQLGRLKMLSKKNFCAAQGRDLQTWGSEVQSHRKYDVVLVASRSEQEVRLRMSLPVPATVFPGLEQHLGTACGCSASGK